MEAAKKAIKLLSGYLLLSGLLAHLLGIAVYLHFRSTGLTEHRYVTKGIEVLDRDSSPTRHLAGAARLALLDSGLVSDPVDRYPPDISTELPQWRGMGASVLRRDTAPRYTSDGTPIATRDRDRWALSEPPAMRPLRVDSVEGLEAALAKISPGEQIILKPGHYRLSGTLELTRDGAPLEPLSLRGESIGSVVIELADDTSVAVSGKYWTVSDLIVRGRCTDGACPHLFETRPGADGFTVRNLFVSGIRSLINTLDGAPPAIPGLIDGVTLVGGRVSAPGLGWARHSIREIEAPAGPDGFLTLCAQGSTTSDCDADDLADAVRRMAKGGLLLIRTGTYRQAATLRTDGLHILAEPGAALRRKSVQGKGALVVDADTTIEGLECSHVAVRDGNGCCIRQQRGDLTLIGVHFHHSQMGLLSGHNGGNIRILDSYFHDNGYDESGNLGHNIYVNSGSLEFVRSWSLSARNAGHELKSRAERTLIEDSLLASLNARDSRLVDQPDGGLLEIRGSVLGKGTRSENPDMIGYGLEIRDRKPPYKDNRVIIRRNTVYADRPQGARLLNALHALSSDVTQNVVIGKTSAPPGNTRIDDRDDAGLAPYPALYPQTF